MAGRLVQEFVRMRSATPADREAVLTDAQYASLLMRLDTSRSKTMHALEVQQTFAETTKELFRAFLMVLPAERATVTARIREFYAAGVDKVVYRKALEGSR
jgi:hypothetical protein